MNIFSHCTRTILTRLRPNAEMPTITVPRSHVLVSEGEEAELACEVDGIPRPRLTWRRDGVLVSHDSQYTAAFHVRVT